MPLNLEATANDFLTLHTLLKVQLMQLCQLGDPFILFTYL
jgi:hypothetical protein